MTDLARTDDTGIVGAETLTYLGLDPRRPEVRALVLLCQRYRLDPLLGHAAIIAAKGGNKAYITRDGMLEIAHRSGQLDGIVVDDQHQTEHGGHSATVSVWRKDMTHPFTYKGGCGHEEPQTKAGNGPEMALARAERRALRRAFSIPAYDDDEPYEQTGEIVVVETGREPPWKADIDAAKQALPLDVVSAIAAKWKDDHLPPVWRDDFTPQHAEELIRRLEDASIQKPSAPEPPRYEPDEEPF